MKSTKPRSFKLIDFLKRFILAYGFFIILVPFINWSQDTLGIGTFLNTSLSLNVLKALGIGQRIMGWFIDSIGNTLFMVILFSLYKLLERIRVGQPFSKESISLYEKIARFYLFSIIYDPISKTMMSLVTSWHLPVEQRTLSISFGTENINGILLATCLYLIVFLTKQAHQISEEQSTVI